MRRFPPPRYGVGSATGSRSSPILSASVVLVSVLTSLFHSTCTTAFVLPSSPQTSGTPYRRRPTFLPSSGNDGGVDFGKEIRGMRAKEIKAELVSLGIRTDDVFEKEELVSRLVDARSEGLSAVAAPPSPPSAAAHRRRNPRISVIPLPPVSTENIRRVPANNARLGSVTLDPRYTGLRTITLTLPSSPSPTPTLTLMVDTACSEILLRPAAVREHGLETLGGAGASMTTAGGTATTGVALLEGFALEDGRRCEGLHVTVHDTGALPPLLDGIVGLSFLRRFGSVVFDFARDELILSEDLLDASERGRNGGDDGLETVTDAALSVSRIGVYSADVLLDGRGPVSMLVDTGAAASYLNWAAVTEDMGLEGGRDHPLVERNTESLGVMGADDTAMELTHRFVCRRRLRLEGGGDPFLTGLDLTQTNGGGGGSDGSVDIDIGDLPVFEGLRAEKVNGILGADLLTKCDALRIDFGVWPPKMSLERKVGGRDVSYLDLV